MKTYPKIRKSDEAFRHFGENCHVFLKYDGSNIRAEWNKKTGWGKFGARNTILDLNDPVLGKAADLFLNKYSSDLESIFVSNKSLYGDKVTVFFEFFGSKSFGGMHFPDDRYDVILFDVNPNKRGFMDPQSFVDSFGHLMVAERIATTILCQDLIDKIRASQINIDSTYDIRSSIPEGVICKGGFNHKAWMYKIKTDLYKSKLKELYQSDWIKYWES